MKRIFSQQGEKKFDASQYLTKIEEPNYGCGDSVCTFSTILQKNQTLQNIFIFYVKMAQWLQK